MPPIANLERKSPTSNDISPEWPSPRDRG
jgi:hypothetical protein